MIQIRNFATGSLILEVKTLHRADLQYSDLKGADLRWEDLEYTNLLGADLRNANLRGADLRNANLRGADLRNANLQYANLRKADIRGADLRGADLRDADLRKADLHLADFRDADLQSANLKDANLESANLKDADLRGVTWPLDLKPLSKKQENKNLQLVASLALSSAESLNMNQAHTCDTTHCMAGWATHAISGGSILEAKYNWWLAGFHLLGAEASKMFHASEEDARSFLKQYS